MPRDSSGNYTLPPSNPVVTNTPIASGGWANPTMSDLGNEITNSLDRAGRGGMTGPFGVVDGTLSAPGLRFTADPDNGLRRIGTNNWALVAAGADVAQLSAAVFTIPAGVTFSMLGTSPQILSPATAAATYLTIANAASTYLTIANAASTYIPLSQKAAANGVASLDATGKVPLAQLPTISVVTPAVAQIRLSLSSSFPVGGDALNQATLYAHPYNGNVITLSNGTVWENISFGLLNLTLSGLSATNPTDIFIRWNAGNASFHSIAWATPTTRADPLIWSNGILHAQSSTTYRYVGTILGNGSGNCDDGPKARLLWNYFNRRQRNVRVFEATTSWTYGTNAWRAANNNAANSIRTVVGQVEDSNHFEVSTGVQNSTATIQNALVGVGIDVTNAVDSTKCVTSNPTPDNTNTMISHAIYDGILTEGAHTVYWLERGSGTDTQSFRGDGPTIGRSCGLVGYVWG
jgi:hypothetical protein